MSKPNHFFEFTLKSKININKNLLVNFTVLNQTIPEIFKVVSSKNGATAIDTSYL